MNKPIDSSKSSINVNNFYEYWKELSCQYSDNIALKDDYVGINYTFKQTFAEIKKFANGLKSLGLKKGEHISMFSENSARWMIADQAILTSGIVNAVRGSASTNSELTYILKHSDSNALIVENLDLLRRLDKDIKNTDLKCIIHLSKEQTKKGEKFSHPAYSFDEVIKLGENIDFEPANINKEDLATLIYTSGTTGKPKGAMLTHYNLMSQVKNCHSAINAKKEGKALCILPIWHAYERTVEYYLLSQGITLCYTNLKNFKKDFKKYEPNYLISVPRIWESIYDGIQKNFNSMPLIKQKLISNCIEASLKYKNAIRLLNKCDMNNFNPSLLEKNVAITEIITNYLLHKFAEKTVYKKIKAGIGKDFEIGVSGGGALAKHLDNFYDAIGIKVFNGYGLTEASPVVSIRTNDNNVLGSIGYPIEKTNIKVCHPETMKELKYGQKGVLLVKGPQVMKGYYKNPEATKEIISKDGWLNTGDMVRLAPNNSIIITGRAKDTIVLSNGENIEPQGIEDACLQSPFIKQIVLTGQDKASLGALVVPDYEYIKENLKEAKGANSKVLVKSPEITELIKKEVKNLSQSRPNYRNFERISNVRLLNEGFSFENGLMTQTMKIKRNEVFNKYANIIEDMMS